MNKVLIGVGIGCGALILLVVVGLGGAFYWGKEKLGGSLQAQQRMQAQEQALAKLEASHPFTAPPEGEVMKLDAARLDAYLAVREGVVPVFQSFEAKGKELEAQHKAPGQKPSVSALLQAANLLAGLVADTRAAYLEGLTQQKMSPTEFQSITTAVYTSAMVGAMDAAQQAGKLGREAMEKQLADLDKQLAGDSLSQEQRAQVEELRTGLREQVNALRDAEANQQTLSAEQKAVVTANMALLKQQQARIEKVANPSFDAFMMGGATYTTPSAPKNYSSPTE